MNDCIKKLKEVWEKTQNHKKLMEEINKTHCVDLTLEEIAYVFGVSRERIRQIETVALKKLRHPKAARELRKIRDQIRYD